MAAKKQPGKKGEKKLTAAEKLAATKAIKKESRHIQFLPEALNSIEKVEQLLDYIDPAERSSNGLGSFAKRNISIATNIVALFFETQLREVELKAIEKHKSKDILELDSIRKIARVRFLKEAQKKIEDLILLPEESIRRQIDN